MVLIFDLAQVKKNLKSADFNIYTEQMQTAERHAERIDKVKQIEQIKSGLCNDDKILICNCGLVGANKSPKRALLK